MPRYILSLVLWSVLFIYTCEGVSKSAVKIKGDLHLFKRQADSHGHGSETAADPMCPVTEEVLTHEFNELAEQLSLTGPDGLPCMVEEHGHDENETEHDKDTPGAQLNLTCESTFEFMEQLLLRLNLTSDCCLENGTACEEGATESTVTRTKVSQAYGYGFLMIVGVSACSLLGVFFVPLIKKNTKVGQLYKYFYSLMIALGASALFCDAVLHLIPEAFGLHGHSGEEEPGAEEDQSFIWKGCVIIAGTYFFFLFETILHTWNPHDHSHGIDSLSKGDASEKATKTTENGVSNRLSNGVDVSDDTSLVEGESHEKGRQVLSTMCMEPTVPHGRCKDTGSTSMPGILHPGATESSDHKPPSYESKNLCLKLVYYIRNIKPLAWLIIFGDAIHNFADGLALGAAISQSLSLGVSTMIALIFHEIPHELGDFVILMSTGMTWYVALLFNLFSALTAVVGFFVGVAISTTSEDANGWILAVAAGIFLYIALVDLLPELIHSNEKGSSRWVMFLMANIGLIISFVALLLLAIYEDALNSLVSL
ncbi:zinc transporter ZIP6-like isoform X1 [Halichondria panicea]|uniref:zinc transporter ZIP6-like isoform X1 n=2 Tax=Halichondria panicea TaxID=6063 RepID=UPI00312B5D11